MIILLTTTVSAAPVEGKNWSESQPQILVFSRRRVFFLFCVPEKEEVEAAEEVEGELSEEEEGRCKWSQGQKELMVAADNNNNQ